MKRLYLVVADATDDSYAIELPKGLRHACFLLELALTEGTPRLKVIWVSAVLNESRQSGSVREHVLANCGLNPLAVLSAGNHYRVACSHVSCAG